MLTCACTKNYNMLILNEPTRAKVCKTEDFPQRKQWLIKMDRVAAVAVNERLWYKWAFTNHLFTTVELWTSLNSTLRLLTARAKMPLWKVIRHAPSGSQEKSLCMNICCYSLPQDPRRRVRMCSLTVYHPDQSHSSGRVATGINEAPNSNVHDPPARQ